MLDRIGDEKIYGNVEQGVEAQMAAKERQLCRPVMCRPVISPRWGWTVVLRRQPARIVEGRPDGGYTNAFEFICCDCGDHLDLDCCDVSPELQRIRGPYPIAAGIAAYAKHLAPRHRRQPIRRLDRPTHNFGAFLKIDS